MLIYVQFVNGPGWTLEQCDDQDIETFFDYLSAITKAPATKANTRQLKYIDQVLP
jgi:hypothetical protein